MKRLLPTLALASLLAGCLSLSSEQPVPAAWTIAFEPAPTKAAETAAESPSRGSIRVSQVFVRAPYDSRDLVVLRADGSLAFDAYNGFAAAPAALLKGAVQDAFLACGAFRSVASASSHLAADVSAETTVTRLALDCREPGRRVAVVELSVLLLKGRNAFASARGEGRADAADGNYSRAFSAAFSQAVSQALAGL